MNKKLTNVWEGIYPLIIYTFLLSFIVSVLQEYTALEQVSAMLLQAVSKLSCIFPMLYFLHKAPRGAAKTKNKVKDALLIILLAVLFNIAFNNIISLTPLKAWSASYQEIEATIYSDSLIWQIVSVGILAPILEEIVFRGILFHNLRAAVGSWPAMIASGIIFGLMHYNLVQFVYAFLLGIFFAYLLEKTGELWTCILAHIAANLFSLFSTDLGIIRWMFSEVTICLLTGIFALIAAVVILIKWKKL